MATLAGPLLADTRSQRADFLELSSLFSSRGKSGGATLLGVLDLSADPVVSDWMVAEPDGEPLDEYIVESQKEHVVATTFDELRYRQGCLGNAYPFLVEAPSCTLTFEPASGPGRAGGDIYLFCLLASAIRSGQVQGGDELKELEKAIAVNFQICACLAAGGFLAGEVSSFGFPRASGDAFLPALRQAFHRFGAGQVREAVPEGMPKGLKDGGIDVIAWREMPDQMPSKLYLLGQCASGRNWKEKSVVEYMAQLGAWFAEPPAQHATPAMFIPFPMHHDLEEPKAGTFTSSLRHRFWFEERRFGIIFDRIRIPHLAGTCLTFPAEARQRVETADRLASVTDWVTQTVRLFRAEWKK